MHKSFLSCYLIYAAVALFLARSMKFRIESLLKKVKHVFPQFRKIRTYGGLKGGNVENCK